MVLKENNIKSVMNTIIDDRIKNFKSFAMFYVANINNEKYTASLKSVNDNVQLDDVSLPTSYAGSGYGFYCLPNINDLCLVGFTDRDYRAPYIITFFYDNNGIGQDQDYIIPIKQKELLYLNQLNGAMIRVRENNDIVLEAGKSNSKIILKNDNTIQLKNKNGWGISITSDGEVQLHGNYLGLTETPMND